MRMLPLLFLLPLCAAPVLAQPAAPPSVGTQAVASTSPTSAPVAAAPAAPVPATAAPQRRLGWEQRFDRANTSHDGHLTLEQAKSGYVTIARHFAQIDADHKGYVTLDAVRAWHKQQREARHNNANRPGDRLQPRPAFHRSLLENPRVDTSSASRTVPAIPNGPPPAPPKGIGQDRPS